MLDKINKTLGRSNKTVNKTIVIAETLLKEQKRYFKILVLASTLLITLFTIVVIYSTTQITLKADMFTKEIVNDHRHYMHRPVYKAWLGKAIETDEAKKLIVEYHLITENILKITYKKDHHFRRDSLFKELTEVSKKMMLLGPGIKYK